MPTEIEKLQVSLEANVKKYENSLKRATEKTKAELDKAARAADDARKRMENSLNNISINPSFGGLRSALAAVASSLGVQKIIEYADTWKNAGNQLAAAGIPADKVGQTLEQLNDVAVESRASFDAVASLFTRLSRATADLGVSQTQVVKITETVSKALSLSGVSASESASAILQLGQALSSGRLQGDELRSLSENAPILARAIADEMGVAIGTLKTLGEQGKITSDRVISAFKKVGPEIQKQFEKTTPTVSQAFTVMTNSATEFVAKLDQAIGFTGLLSKTMINAANAMDAATDDSLQTLSSARGPDFSDTINQLAVVQMLGRGVDKELVKAFVSAKNYESTIEAIAEVTEELAGIEERRRQLNEAINQAAEDGRGEVYINAMRVQMQGLNEEALAARNQIAALNAEIGKVVGTSSQSYFGEIPAVNDEAIASYAGLTERQRLLADAVKSVTEELEQKTAALSFSEAEQIAYDKAVEKGIKIGSDEYKVILGKAQALTAAAKAQQDASAIEDAIQRARKNAVENLNNEVRALEAQARARTLVTTSGDAAVVQEALLAKLIESNVDVTNDLVATTERVALARSGAAAAQKALNEAEREAEQINQRKKDAVKNLQEEVKALEAKKRARQLLTTIGTAAVEQEELLFNLIRDGVDDVDKYIDLTARLADERARLAGEDEARAVEAETRQLQAQAQAMQLATGSGLAYEAQIRLITAALLAKGFVTQTDIEQTRQMGLAYEAAAQKIKEAQDKQEAARQAAADYDQLLNNWASRFADGFMSVVDGSMSAKDAFKLMVADMVKGLIRLGVQMAALAAIGAVLKAFGLDEFVKEGLKLVNSIPGRASGGSVRGGSPYIVGEKGPELFLPGKSGTIIPNNVLTRGRSGGSAKVTVNNYSGAQVDVQNRRSGDGDIIDIVVRRVGAEMSSGRFDSVMGSRYGTTPVMKRR